MAQNTQNTALLVMDMQSSILSRLPDSSEIVSNVGKAIEAARENDIPVIYVVVGFRVGVPEMSANNKGFSMLGGKEKWTAEWVEQWMQIHPNLTPQANDLITIKRRVSAFTGSDLEVILRAQNIQHIILTGVATSGGVLSTAREAADKDYRITVLADCCADHDAEVHQVLTEKVFPRQADVATLDEWREQLKSL